MDPFNHCGLAGSSWLRLGSRGKRSLIRRGFVTGEHHQQPLLSPITQATFPVSHRARRKSSIGSGEPKPKLE
jgi:hypothetical protein